MRMVISKNGVTIERTGVRMYVVLDAAGQLRSLPMEHHLAEGVRRALVGETGESHTVVNAMDDRALSAYPPAAARLSGLARFEEVLPY